MTDHEKRERIARRVARELRDGFYVNLGIGIPTMVSNYVPRGRRRGAAIGKRHAGRGSVSDRRRRGLRPY